MQVKLTTNIGSTDAQRLGLDKVLEGSDCKVTDTAGAILVRSGWAVPVDAPKATKPQQPAPAAEQNKPQA